MLVNDAGNLEPHQFALLVVIRSATPTTPLAAAEHPWNCNCRVDQRAPRAPGTSGTLAGSDCRNRLPVIFRRPHAATRGQQVAEVRRAAFVDPEEVGFHWRLEFGCGEISRATVLAAPRMRVLMRQQAPNFTCGIGLQHDSRRQTAVVRFVVLEPEMGGEVAEREQEVVLAIVPRTKHFARFGDNTCQSLLYRCRNIQIGGFVSHYVE